jgi:hypothetical protein
MLRPLYNLPMLALLLICHSAYAIDITIDTRAAHAVLQALGNPALTHAQALDVASMPQNNAPIRKLAEFNIHTTIDDFAAALEKTAHGEIVSRHEERAFMFDRVFPRRAELNSLLDQIDHDPAAFEGAIRKRIALYMPTGAKIALNEIVVAAGDGGGYTFGSTDFYLNLVMTDDLTAAKIVTTHEMYHAVQGAFATQREGASVAETHDGQAAPAACQSVQRLFNALYEEGSAVEVADVSLNAQLTGPNGSRQRADLEEGASHLEWNVTLLEMSAASFLAKTPVPYDAVYAVGFYGHGALYNVGYAIAKAIVDDRGTAGLGTFLTRPSSDFIRAYTRLASYGKDAQHPPLGPNTIAALELSIEHCRGTVL